MEKQSLSTQTTIKDKDVQNKTILDKKCLDETVLEGMNEPIHDMNKTYYDKAYWDKYLSWTMKNL